MISTHLLTVPLGNPTTLWKSCILVFSQNSVDFSFSLSAVAGYWFSPIDVCLLLIAASTPIGSSASWNERSKQILECHFVCGCVFKCVCVHAKCVWVCVCVCVVILHDSYKVCWLRLAKCCFVDDKWEEKTHNCLVGLFRFTKAEGMIFWKSATAIPCFNPGDQASSSFFCHTSKSCSSAKFFSILQALSMFCNSRITLSAPGPSGRQHNWLMDAPQSGEVSSLPAFQLLKQTNTCRQGIHWPILWVWTKSKTLLETWESRSEAMTSWHTRCNASRLLYRQEIATSFNFLGSASRNDRKMFWEITTCFSTHCLDRRPC